MATVLPSQFVIGPALVYYRAVGVTTPWTSVGVTLDDAIMRITQETFNPDNINGVYGPLMGLDVAQTVSAEIEFTLGEIAGQKISLAIPGSSYTAPVSTSPGGGASTTLGTTSLVGATTLAFTLASGFSVADYFKIDTTTATEYRQITAIQSNNVSFRDPLLFAHTAGVAIAETDSDNRSVVTMPTYRRYPDSAYNEWALVSESGRSGVNELRLPRGIATAAGEMTVTDDAVAGMRVTIAGRLNPSDTTTSLYQLYSPATS